MCVRVRLLRVRGRRSFKTTRRQVRRAVTTTSTSFGFFHEIFPEEIQSDELMTQGDPLRAAILRQTSRVFLAAMYKYMCV